MKNLAKYTIEIDGKIIILKSEVMKAAHRARKNNPLFKKAKWSTVLSCIWDAAKEEQNRWQKIEDSKKEPKNPEVIMKGDFSNDINDFGIKYKLAN